MFFRDLPPVYRIGARASDLEDPILWLGLYAAIIDIGDSPIPMFPLFWTMYVKSQLSSISIIFIGLHTAEENYVSLVLRIGFTFLLHLNIV